MMSMNCDDLAAHVTDTDTPMTRAGRAVAGTAAAAARREFIAREYGLRETLDEPPTS